MDTSLKIGIILASVREGRRGGGFAEWIHGLAAQRPGVTAEIVDLREWPLPAYLFPEGTLAAEKKYPPGSLERRWTDKVASFDAFVVVTPEYTHSYPGSLKNALDHAYAGWNYKPVGFVSYGGFSGGVRAVEQLRLVAVELRMVPIRDEVNIRLVGFTPDARGFPTEELYQKRAAALLDELSWWTRVVKSGRAENPR